MIDANYFKNKDNLSLIYHKNAFLYQNSDELINYQKNFKVVSKKKPSKQEIESLIFAFHICKFVKSNAIVLVKDKSTLGIGAGQPSRLESCNLAVSKARKFQNKKQ